MPDHLAAAAHVRLLRAEVAVGVDLHLQAAVAEDALGDDRHHVDPFVARGHDERGGLVVRVGGGGADAGDEDLVGPQQVAVPGRLVLLFRLFRLFRPAGLRRRRSHGAIGAVRACAARSATVRAVPHRAVPHRAVPRRAVACRALRREGDHYRLGLRQGAAQEHDRVHPHQAAVLVGIAVAGAAASRADLAEHRAGVALHLAARHAVVARPRAQRDAGQGSRISRRRDGGRQAGGAGLSGCFRSRDVLARLGHSIGAGMAAHRRPHPLRPCPRNRRERARAATDLAVPCRRVRV